MALKLEEGEPGEFNEDISGEKEKAQEKAQAPEIFALDIAAAVVDRGWPCAIGRENAHETERIAEQERPARARDARNGDRDNEEDLK